MEKIKKLRQLIKKEKIDGYLIPKNDEFFGEDIPKYNDRLNYISNFSGSFGLSLILKSKNYLFVDGRYTLQANKQSGNQFKIITIPKTMPMDILKNKKLSIGFDPKLFTRGNLQLLFGNSNFKFKPIYVNLIDKIWKRKLSRKTSFFYTLPNKSVGFNYKLKINKIISFLKEKNADLQFITASENNAWLFNVRGKDAEYSPLPNFYTLIDKSRKISFFCDLNKISINFRKKFKEVKFINIKFLSKTLSKIKNKINY